MQFYIIALWAHLVRWCSDIYHTFVHNLTILNRFKPIRTVVRYDIEHQRQKKKERRRWAVRTLSGRRNRSSSRIKYYFREDNSIWNEKWQREDFQSRVQREWRCRLHCCYELISGTTSTDSGSSTNPGTMGNQGVLAVEHLGQSHVIRSRWSRRPRAWAAWASWAGRISCSI